MIPSVENSLRFFGVALLLSFAPGPDNLFVFAQTLLQGRLAGFIFVTGLCTGLIVHTALVACGLGAAFAASPVAFDVVRYLGAVYLAWLAWLTFRSANKLLDAPNLQNQLSLKALYGRGVVMNLTNPKVLLFFVAFLPQFIELERGYLPQQIGWFGGIFLCATFIAFGTIVQLAGWLGAQLGKSAKAQYMLNLATAGLFSLLAVRMLLLKR